MRARRALGALVVLAVLLVSGPAAAQERSLDAATAADLARRAVDDDAALADLRRVESVDGRPVDLAAATADLGRGRQERLEALADALDPAGAGAEPGTAVAPDQARESARRVLDDDKFQPTELPRPFRRPLELLADLLRPVGRFLHRLVQPILDLPGGPFVLGALLVAASSALVARLIGRRSRAAIDRSDAASRLVDPLADPEELDRRAEAAETAGDLAAAVRFRYEAGLLRLVRAGRLELRPDTTAADAARQVGEAVMDRLTADFEEVVYGGRAAAPADVASARSGWVELLGVRVRR